MKKIILLILVMRIFMIFLAFHGDLNNNISWGNVLVKYGASGYYEQKNWDFSSPNQPPLYILLFGLTSFIYQSVTNVAWYLNNSVGFFPSSFVWFWQDKGMVLLVKLPSILADVGIGYLIYKFFRDKGKKESGFKLSVLWLFNPISWYNSSIWGQTDAIVNFLGLVAILFLLRKGLVKFAVFYVLSILFKPSLIIFAPVLLTVAILQKYKGGVWLRSVFVGGLVALAISVWFHPAIDLPIWLFDLYTQRFFPGEIGYLTANAFNFWWLVDSGKTLDSQVYLGIPARILGYVMAFLGIGGVIFWLKKRPSEKNTFYALAICALGAFLFMTRIHERYLYPFFPIATILIGFEPIILIPYLILSVTHVLNLYHLFWAPGIPLLESYLKIEGFPIFLSFVNIGIFLIMVGRIFRFGKEKRV